MNGYYITLRSSSAGRKLYYGNLHGEWYEDKDYATFFPFDNEDLSKALSRAQKHTPDAKKVEGTP